MESPVTFRVSQIPLYIYIKKGEDLSHQVSQLFFFYSKVHLFKTREMAFRARKVIRTFEKRVPDQLKKTRLDSRDWIVERRFKRKIKHFSKNM